MSETQTPVLELIQYTDPYCTWCWGSEPIMRRIEEVYGGQIRMDFVMGGLVEDATAFYDPLNRIGGPEMAQQVADHWREASERHGMPVDADVWLDMKDEFVSTWPANVAVKAAQMQAARRHEPALAARYLRRLREAAATERRLIHRAEVQAEIATEVGLDAAQLLKDIDGGEPERAFEADRRQCAERHVTGFPSFLIRRVAGVGTAGVEAAPGQEEDEFMFFGYHTFDQFVPLFERLAGGRLAARQPEATPENIAAFVRKYGKAVSREVAEVFSLKPDEALAMLDGLVEQGVLSKTPAGNGWFYSPAEI